MTIKIGIFFLFIVLYVAYLGFAFYLLAKMGKAAIAKRNYLYSNAMLFALNYCALFGFIWVLSGFVDISFAALLLATQIFSIALISIGYALMKRKDINWAAHLSWENFLLAKRHPVMQVAGGGFSLVYLVAFPIWAGWVYFRNPLWSEVVVERIFVGTAAYFLLGMVLLLPQAIAMLTSPTLDENARDRVLIVQLGGFIGNGLLIAMILSVLRIAAGGGPPISPIPLGLSGIVVSTLVIFLLVAYALPYLIGVQRAKRTREKVNAEMQELLQDTVDEFKAPRTPSARADFIARLQDRIARQIEELRRTWPQIDLAATIEEARKGSSLPETTPKRFQTVLPLLCQMYDEVQPFDPYISQWKRLKKLGSDLSELTMILSQPDQGFVPDPISRQVSILESHLTKTEGGHVPNEGWGMSVLITSILSALATPFLEKAGKLIVEPIAEAAGIKLGMINFLLSILS